MNWSQGVLWYKIFLQKVWFHTYICLRKFEMGKKHSKTKSYKNSLDSDDIPPNETERVPVVTIDREAISSLAVVGQMLYSGDQSGVWKDFVF